MHAAFDRPGRRSTTLVPGFTEVVARRLFSLARLTVSIGLVLVVTAVYSLVPVRQPDDGRPVLRRRDPAGRQRLGRGRIDGGVARGHGLPQRVLPAAGRHAHDRRSAELDCPGRVSHDRDRRQPVVRPRPPADTSRRWRDSAISSSSTRSAAVSCSRPARPIDARRHRPTHRRRLRLPDRLLSSITRTDTVSWAGRRDVPALEQKLREVARQGVSAPRGLDAGGGHSPGRRADRELSRSPTPT